MFYLLFQRRDLRKKVRVENGAEVATQAVGNTAVIAPVAPVSVAPVLATSQNETLQNVEQIQPLVSSSVAANVDAVENTEMRENRNRRLPRHLRVGNQRRKENNARPRNRAMPLVAAVASPEAASGKILLSVYQRPAKQQEKSNFLSVDEMLEQQSTHSTAFSTAHSTDVVPQATVEPQASLEVRTEEKSYASVPFGGFVTQHTDRDLVKEKHERMAQSFVAPEAKEEVQNVEVPAHTAPFGGVVSQPSSRDLVKEKNERVQQFKANATVAPAIGSATQEIVVPVSTYQSEYVFEGKLGTFSRVEHTKAVMTKAESPSEGIATIEPREWLNSKYYFYGKGFGGHSSAISHVQAAPRVAVEE